MDSRADISGSDKIRLKLDIAKATYSEQRNDIRMYEQRQTMAFNFANRLRSGAGRTGLFG